jgi:hypothetical protein
MAKSYFQKYDRDKHHKSNHPAGEQASPPTTSIDMSTLLTGRERTVLTAVIEKVEQMLDNPSQLTEEDWAILSPLALRLSDLLRRAGRSQE